MDVVMFTETGVKKTEKIWKCDDEMEIIKENKVKHEKKGVLICGKGTVMMARQGIRNQKASDKFNSEKTISHIIKLKENGN